MQGDVVSVTGHSEIERRIAGNGAPVQAQLEGFEGDFPVIDFC